MSNKTKPSIFELFSRFHTVQFGVLCVLVISLTAYWGSLSVSEKSEQWEVFVSDKFETNFSHELNDILSDVYSLTSFPLLSAFLETADQPASDLIRRKIIGQLASTTTEHDALTNLSVLDDSNNVLVESHVKSFNKSALQRVTPSIDAPRLGANFDGIFRNEFTGEFYFGLKMKNKKPGVKDDSWIYSYISISKIVTLASDEFGNGGYLLWNGREPIINELTTNEADFSGLADANRHSETGVFQFKDNVWLSYNLGENTFFVQLNDPHLGLSVYLWEIVLSILILATLGLAISTSKSKIKQQFDSAIAEFTKGDLSRLTDPDSFRYREGQLIASSYRPHINILNQKVRELEQLAFKDPLTGFLNNRSFLIEVDALTLKKDSEFIVLSIDVNHFERISTAHGMSVANQMLVYLAEKISDFLMLQSIQPFEGYQHGFVIGMVAPHRFGVIFNGKDKNIDESYLAQNIINMTKRTIRINNNEIFVTTNIGTSFYPYDAQNCHDLLQRASIALEKSKNVAEAHYCVYSGEFQGDLVRVETLQSDMHRAQKQEEFRLLYQPVFNDRNKTVGVEALIRWNHPTFGLISPDEFIAIAEGNGAIVDIGYWIIIHACKQAAQWRKNGLRQLTMSINVSCKQLLDRDFAHKVFHAVEASGIDPSKLCLEITETIAMNADDTIQRNIASIKEHGIQISMDDFGTGHSSLARLIDMQVDVIKIDRNFVKNIETSQAKLRIVKSISEMSKALELDIICEGVENLSQLTLLKEMGIKKFQGFVFSKPVSEQKIEERIRSESNNVVSIDMRKH